MNRSHSSYRLFVAVAGLLLAAVGTARAEDAPAATTAPAAAPAHRSLIGMRCKDDAAKVCSGVEIGGGRLARCLRLHDSDLSEPCKAALAAADKKGAPAAAASTTAAPAEATTAGPHAGMGMGKGMGHGMGHGMGMGHEWGAMKDMRKTCAADVEKLCKDVQPGHGRVAVCLNEHASELSPACKKMVDTVTEEMSLPMEMHADCAADVQKFCSDVPAGSGRVAFCMGEHAKELSPACKKHVTEMKAHWKKHVAAAKAGGTSGANGAGGAPGTAAHTP